MEQQNQCKYLSIKNIQEEYLPISRKKIRAIVKENLPAKVIGGRLYVGRNDLEEYLENETGTDE